jgi:FkbM family methyltransferase
VDAWIAAKTEARSIARRAGLTRLILAFQERVGGDRGYEPKVMAFLRAAVAEDDTVWDVGANVGEFTLQFSDWVGQRGRVVAFEPVPACFAALCERTAECANLECLNVGLGEAEAKMSMHLAEDPQARFHTLVATRDDTPGLMEITVHAGDAIRRERQLPIPNVLKIDVEGFEPEVLRGLDATLREPACRSVLCEVHYALLESRGQKHAPDEIRRYLEDRGFSSRWITPSHLAGTRAPE